jgi:mono/diheme cytochrome c family protein
MRGWLTQTIPWPFPLRPSLEALSDPGVRLTIGGILLALGVCVLLLTLAIRTGRSRLPATLLLASAAGIGIPLSGQLWVKATPTSYRPSPTGFTAASILAGQAVFAANCVPCHGEKGDGRGGRGKIASLLRHHIWEHKPGDLFWFVSHGRQADDGGPGMPAFETTLPETSRWSAIDYVLALNAGSVAHGLAGWPHRVPAPDIGLACQGLGARSLADLRGKAVRLLLGPEDGPIPPLPPVNGIPVVTVWLTDQALAAAPLGADCTARANAGAYAVLAGATDGHILPARFLIDPEGVLRSVRRMGEDDGEADDPARLLDDVRTICTEPLTIETGEAHDHDSPP